MKKIYVYLFLALCFHSSNAQFTFNNGNADNVGIGTKSPQNKLEVWNNLIAQNNAVLDFSFGNQNGRSFLNNYKKFAGWSTLQMPISISPGGNNVLLIHSSGISVANENINPSYALNVNGKGYFSDKVLVGTNDLNKVSGYKLAVNGAAIFNKVTIKNFSVWPDYVFENNYDLLNIKELEVFIKKYNHLPNIPGRDEVKKNDINVSELLIKQLIKIEESTLYIIQLEKRIANLEKMIEGKSSKRN